MEAIIEKLIYGGEGLARVDGEIYFVPFVIPGEKVEIRPLRKKQGYWESELLSVVEPSPDRTEPQCPYFSRCGGCHWQHIRYETQIEWKQKIVRETLERIGKIENPKVLPTIPSSEIWGWRSRILVHGDGEGKVGFYESNSRRVVDIEKCLVADSDVNAQLHQIRSSLKSVKADRELRSDSLQGFSQVNPFQNEKIKSLLCEWTEPLPKKHIVELFCGDGNFSQIFLKEAEIFIGVDSNPQAIEKAAQTSGRPDIRTSGHPDIGTSPQFLCSDAARWYAQYSPKEELDLLILDPPRDGCGKVVEGVLKTRPKNILYISCNPATLARDLKYLREFAGYGLVQTQPIDMFPHSFHIETVSLVKKQ